MLLRDVIVTTALHYLIMESLVVSSTIDASLTRTDTSLVVEFIQVLVTFDGSPVWESLTTHDVGVTSQMGWYFLLDFLRNRVMLVGNTLCGKRLSG